MKKSLSGAIGILAAFSSLMPIAAPVASAQTASSNSCHTFDINLGEGRYLSTADAQGLQIALANAGLWSSGTSITAYNDAVASAVSGFQEKYAAQILTPNGLSYGTGFVGASTRTELNSLYGCSGGSSAPSSANTVCPDGYVCTPINHSASPVQCPTGYVCTAIPAQPTQYPANYQGVPNQTLQSSTSAYSDGGSSSNSSVTDGPTLFTISPSSGSGGQAVTLTGTGFSNQTQVIINDAMFTAGVGGPVSPSGVSPSGTSLTFVMPSGLASGLYLISAENVSGSSARFSNYLHFSIGAPVSQNPSFSLAGVPSIVKNISSQDAQGNITSTYTATFAVNATAGYAPLTYGLANATIPAFAVTPSFVAIYKNGTQDQLSNYNVSLSYSAPINNAAISSDGTAFLVSPGQTATIPVTYSFSIANPGANAYAVELEGIRSWASLDSSMAGSSTWRTASI